MNWLHYLTEANLYLCVFYLFYCLLLNKETYYTFNRVYLLFSCGIAFVLPLLQVGTLKPVEPAAQTVVATVLPLQADFAYTPPTLTVAPADTFPIRWEDGLYYAYLAGVGIMVILLIVRFYKLFKLGRAKAIAHNKNYKLVYLDDTNTAFSFFNYLYLGANTTETETIIRHELVHIRQKHSFDVMLLELFKIVNWFNPFVYLLQNSLKTVHEYIADEQTAAVETDTLAYSTFLVSNAYGLSGSSITHSFFNYNLLKKRILMLHRERSGKLAGLKYLVALPLCVACLCVSTLGFSKTYGWVDLSPTREANNINMSPKASERQLADTIKTQKRNLSTTSKGYRYQEEGYLINKKSNYRVIITEKNGDEKAYFKNSATPAQIKLLADKYGYTFPKTPIYDRLPPPPPAPMADKNTLPPPPPPAPPAPKKVDQVKFPPLSVYKNGYEDFYAYFIKTVHYPPEAFKHNEPAALIVHFTISGDHKMSDIRLDKGAGSDFDPIVTNAFKSYGGVITDKPGDHYIIVRFSTNGNYAMLGPYDDKQPGYAGIISIRGRFDAPVVVQDAAKPKVGNVNFNVPLPSPNLVNDSLRKHAFDSFYAQLAKTIKYPNEAKANYVNGKVYVSFSVDEGHKVQDIQILRGPADILDNEVVRSLKDCAIVTAAKPGITYVVPVNFYLDGYNGPATTGGVVTLTGRPINNSNSHPALELNEIVVTGYLGK